jgi:hypothetical protein
MNSLLELTDNGLHAQPRPESAELDPFRVLIDRDTSKNKKEATKELSFVYHMCDTDSPYFQSVGDKEVRENELVRDLWGEEGAWEPDDEVKKAIKYYRDHHMTPAQQLLESALESVTNLRDYFKDADPMARDDNGRVVWKAKDIVSNLSKIGDVIKGLKELKEEVRKEQIEGGDNRGGVEVNRFSR